MRRCLTAASNIVPRVPDKPTLVLLDGSILNAQELGPLVKEVKDHRPEAVVIVFSSMRGLGALAYTHSDGFVLKNGGIEDLTEMARIVSERS